MKTVLVSGSLAFDRIMDFPGLFRDHFVEGKLHNINVSFVADRYTENFGGTAGNIAYNLMLMGLSSRIISAVGDDFSHYRADLEKHAVDLSHIITVEGEKTATANIITDKGDNQIAAFYAGASVHAYEGIVPLEGTSLAIVAPGNVSDMVSVPRACAQLKIPFFYDPGQQIPQLDAEQLRVGITGAAVVFANDYEFGMIAKKTGWDEGEILKRATVLVITEGSLGSRVLTQNGEVRVRAVPALAVIDPTGAGDAYRAGYAAGFLRDQTPEVCARLGSVSASFSVEQYGTQTHRFELDNVASRYQTAYNEKCPL